MSKEKQSIIDGDTSTDESTFIKPQNGTNDNSSSIPAANNDETKDERKEDDIDIDPTNDKQAEVKDDYSWRTENIGYRAESYMACAGMSTFFLAFAIADIQSNITNDGEEWDNITYFYLYCIFQSLAVGSGLYCTLCFSFIGFKLKRQQGQDVWYHAKEAKSMEEKNKCLSHNWYKDKEYRPIYWCCIYKHSNWGTPEIVIRQSSFCFAAMFTCYIMAVVFYMADNIEHRPGLISVMIICFCLPLILAIHILYATDSYAVY